MTQFVLFLSLLLYLLPGYAFGQDALELSKKMISTCNSFQTIGFTLKKEERIHGAMKGDKSTVKLNVKPLKIYYKQEYPKAGLELLYSDGTNGNQALIHTNGFPWVNVSLDPYGSQMRADQHHTLYKLGFGSMMDILDFLYKKYGSKSASMMSLQGSATFDGVDCWIIQMSNPEFRYIDYTIKSGETLISIAKRLRLSEHMILEKNKLSDYSDVTAGTVIKIPTDYAKKMTMYLAKKTMVPLVIKVYDDIGLYESYEYTGVKINPPYKPEEFTQDHTGYGF